MKKCLLFIVLLSFSQFIFGQFSLDKNKEPIYFGVGFGSAAIGYGFLNKYPELTTEDIQRLIDTPPNTPFKIDYWATKQSSKKAKLASDLLLFSSILPPLFVLLDRPKTGDENTKKVHAVMLAESFAITWGLTNLAKRFAKRPRPFMHNNNLDIFPIAKRKKSDARMSFFSGHTSGTAAMYYFTAVTYSKYYPDSKWKPFFWGTSVSIPALTGFFRVKAGKHFPTDVIVGYVVGALIGGVLVPKLH